MPCSVQVHRIKRYLGHAPVRVVEICLYPVHIEVAFRPRLELAIAYRYRCVYSRS